MPIVDQFRAVVPPLPDRDPISAEAFVLRCLLHRRAANPLPAARPKKDQAEWRQRTRRKRPRSKAGLLFHRLREREKPPHTRGLRIPGATTRDIYRVWLFPASGNPSKPCPQRRAARARCSLAARGPLSRIYNPFMSLRFLEYILNTLTLPPFRFACPNHLRRGGKDMKPLASLQSLVTCPPTSNSNHPRPLYL